ELGLKATINSDDPAYFGGQVNKNYEDTQKALGLTKSDLYELAKNSFQYSFLSPIAKEIRIQELDKYYAEHDQ
ncbi:MAG: adenosine deaminase, partial [Flavobacteriales bacterium]|nr:adenosine deaminase [Flavobacteriales bacterium]